MDADESDDEYNDSDTSPVNTTMASKKGAMCPVCNARFTQSENARPECGERSAKSNLERHAQKKGEDGDEAPGCYIHPPTIELAVVGYKSFNLNSVP